MGDKLFGVYKEVGKEPRPKVIWNTEEDIKKLLGGDYTSIKCSKFTIIYRKNSESMLANVCIDIQGRGLGTSIKGKLFVVKENEKGEFISFPNMDELGNVANFLKAKALDYKNFDEKGRYMTRAERRKRELENFKKKHSKELKKVTAQPKNNEFDISDSFFENNLRLVPINKDKNVNSNQDENNSSDLNENGSESKKRNDTTNNTKQTKNTGKPILERTQESSTTKDDLDKDRPVINLPSDAVLKMLLKVQFIILDYLKKLMAYVDEDDI